jgi:hypothetical protein
MKKNIQYGYRKHCADVHNLLDKECSVRIRTVFFFKTQMGPYFFRTDLITNNLRMTMQYGYYFMIRKNKWLVSGQLLPIFLQNVIHIQYNPVPVYLFNFT